MYSRSYLRGLWVISCTNNELLMCDQLCSIENECTCDTNLISCITAVHRELCAGKLCVFTHFSEVYVHVQCKHVLLIACTEQVVI